MINITVLKKGKIMVKNSNLMSRFLNNKAATEEFFDKDGYGFTGRSLLLLKTESFNSYKFVIQNFLCSIPDPKTSN